MLLDVGGIFSGAYFFFLSSTLLELAWAEAAL